MEREEQIVIDEAGNTIPIKVEEIDGIHVISVDGIDWAVAENMVHATILFEMMKDHLTEYMTYKRINAKDIDDLD